VSIVSASKTGIAERTPQKAGNGDSLPDRLIESKQPGNRIVKSTDDVRLK